MGKLKSIPCSWCGKLVKRYESEIGKHVFCCGNCRSKFISKKTNPVSYKRHPHLSKYNKITNPSKMTEEIKAKLRWKRFGTGQHKSYPKLYGRHIHRIVAEAVLGRKLKRGEVVHHIDGNRLNNRPENLLVLPNQAEHAKLHGLLNRGDAL